MKVALAHEFLVQYGGAERVLEVFHDMFPDAPVYTFLYDAQAMPDAYRSWDIRPLIRSNALLLNHYKRLFPLYPWMAGRFRVEGYDLLVSSSYAYMHGLRVGSTCRHVTYCHTPMRFAWAQRDEYRKRVPWMLRKPYDLVIARLRHWDMEASTRPSEYVTNSLRMAERIQRTYGRTAVVVYPPMPLRGAHPSHESDGYYLVVARLVYPYKRVDIAIDAFNRLRLPLKIVGDGSDREWFERRAGPTVEFLGHRGNTDLATLYARCKAVVMPWDEDFGIVPLEANAFGKPVIALNRDGLKETQSDGVTGILFDDATPASLAAAVKRFEAMQFDPTAIARTTERYSVERFTTSLRAVIDRTMSKVTCPDSADITDEVRDADAGW